MALNISAHTLNITEESFNDKMIQTLTSFLVPVAFGIILTVGLVGNLLVITVVRNVTKLS